MFWLVVVVGCGCGLRGGPSVLGFATVVMLIFGGWVPQDLCSSHVRCLKSSAAPGGRCSGDKSLKLLCASRDARAASLAATGVFGMGLA